MKLNPYEQGVADARNRVRRGNPFPTFTQRWALYNKGFNSQWLPEVGPTSEPPHGCGHMQGRGAA